MMRGESPEQSGGGEWGWGYHENAVDEGEEIPQGGIGEDGAVLCPYGARGHGWVLAGTALVP